jgi:hypothetical protein
MAVLGGVRWLRNGGVARMTKINQRFCDALDWFEPHGHIATREQLKRFFHLLGFLKQGEEFYRWVATGRMDIVEGSESLVFRLNPEAKNKKLIIDAERRKRADELFLPRYVEEVANEPPPIRFPAHANIDMSFAALALHQLGGLRGKDLCVVSGDPGLAERCLSHER